jgi:hypothetical protein
MTIAACYVSPEGVVLGADSTTTVLAGRTRGNQPEEHFFDFGQKIFELGEKDATLGIVTWGLGGFPNVSYRTLYAEFADDLKGNPPASVEDAMKRWIAKFWSTYDSVSGNAYRQALAAAKTDDERKQIEAIGRNNTVGFCIGGIALPNRRPDAYEVQFSVTDSAPPQPKQVPSGEAIFRGVPMLIDRMLYGIDPDLFEKIASSPNWTGGGPELLKLVEPFLLGHPGRLPIREAIDWICSCIQSTIKGVKFSPYRPICGGPVEIAVITSDRPFRWVRHKALDAAIRDGETNTHPEAL